MAEKILGGATPHPKNERFIPNDGNTTAPDINTEATAENTVDTSLETIRMRLAASTSAGGLASVPQSFEDKNGDWQTIHSDNPFDVLYLDYKQYKIITAEIVKKNYDIITNFWKGKNKGYATGNRELLKAKYGEDNLTKAFKKLDKAYEQLSSHETIAAYYKEIDDKRYNNGLHAVRDLIEISMSDGEFTKNEANTLIKKALENDLSEPEIKEYLLRSLKEKGFKPRATTLKPDEFDNKWMTDEKWKEAQSRFTTINSVAISSLEEYGNVLFKSYGYAIRHLANANYIITEVTKLSDSDKAMEFEDIVEKEKDIDRRILKVIYHLNPNLPFRLQNEKLYENIESLLKKGYDNYAVHQRIYELFSKEHIQIWIKENDPVSALKLSENIDYKSLLQFSYKVNNQFPFYLKDELIQYPSQLVEKINVNKKYWYTTIQNLKNGNIPTWFEGINHYHWLQEYNIRVTDIITAQLHTEDEVNLASVQALTEIIEPKQPQPTLLADKKSIELLEIEGSDKTLSVPITIRLQTTGFVKAVFVLSNSFDGIWLSTNSAVFFSQGKQTDTIVTLFIAAPKLQKQNVYDFQIIMHTLYEQQNIPVQLKAVFPKKAFVSILGKYAIIFAVFFALTRSAFEYMGAAPFLFLCLFIGLLTWSVFVIKKYEKI